MSIPTREKLLDLLAEQPAVLSTGGQVLLYLNTLNDTTSYAVPITAPYVSAWMSVRHTSAGHLAPTPSEIKSALFVKQCQCLGGPGRGRRAPTHVRYAWSPNDDFGLPQPSFVLCLDTVRGYHVDIDSQGWTPKSTPTIFLHDPLQQALPEPEVPAENPDSPLQAFRKLIGLDAPQQDANWQTLLNWTLTAMRPPKNPAFHNYPILNLMGSAKSITARMLTQIIDPTQTPVHSLPTTERKLHGLCASHHVLTFDDAGRINPEKSRQLSRLAAGVASTHKQIDGMLVRPIILTTDDESQTKHLAEKLVDITLPDLDAPPDPEQIFEEFETLKPQILGALLSLLTEHLDAPPPCRPNRKNKYQKIEATVTEFLKKQEAGTWEGTCKEFIALTQACPTPEAMSAALDHMQNIEVTHRKRKNNARIVELHLFAE